MKPCSKNQLPLALLAAGVLEDSQRGPLLAHTADCAACRDYLNELSKICRDHAAAVEGLPAMEVSGGFRRRLAERIRTEEPTTASHSLAGWISQTLAPRWRIALLLGGAALGLLVLVPRKMIVPPQPAPNNPSTISVAMNATASPQVWLNYQSAANQSFDALDALLARHAAVPAPRSPHVTAGMRGLPGLTD